MFTLTISCLTTSNLPWFMDITLQVPMQYCSLQHRTFTSITSHIHNWALCLPWLHLFILSGFISPLFSSSILGTYRSGEFIFQCHIFCLFILFMGFSRKEYWSGFFAFSSGPRFVRTLHHDASILCGPYRSWFHWVRQGCGPYDQFD